MGEGYPGSKSSAVAVERAQTHRAFERLDSWAGLVEKDLRVTTCHPGMGGVGVEHQRPVGGCGGIVTETGWE
jgi:hypothetical protein